MVLLAVDTLPLLPTPALLTDDALCDAFASGRIPASSWNHLTHVRIARLLLAHAPFFSALATMRAGIRRLNRAHGLIETNEQGYHETLTTAWMTFVAAAMACDPGVTSLDFWIRHPALHDPRARLFACYSPELLRTRTARARFVPPDRAPLPPVLDGRDSCQARAR